MAAHRQHPSDNRPTRRRRSRTPVVASAAVAAGLLTLSGVWLNSYAAFTAQTSNPGNQWAAGTVTLSDDDGGSTAMFNVSGLAPGQSGSNCIKVSYGGTLAATVKLYGTAYSQTNTLGDNVTFTITQGTGGAFNGCTGFVADTSTGDVLNAVTATAFATADTDFSTGVGTWAPSGAASKTYKVDWSMPSAATAGQGGTINLGFTWEAQNS
jgi:hypothetical protein